MRLRLFDPLYHCNVSQTFKVNQYEKGATFAKIIYPYCNSNNIHKEYPAAFPILFFIQENGIDATSLDQEVAQLAQLARCGYCVVILSYRDASFGKLPIQIHDVMDSIYSLLSVRYGNYPLDKSNYFISGNGFGAYLAVQAALHIYAKYPTLDSSCLKGVIDFYGPTSFNEIDLSNTESNADMIRSLYSEYFDATDEEMMDELSLLSSLNETTQRFPLFIIHGLDDMQVPFDHSKNLADIALANCFDVIYLELEGATHGQDLIFGDSMLSKVNEYMHRQLFPDEDPYRY